MRVTLSQVVYRTLLIYSPTTGGLAAPDATPSASVVKNGTTDGAVTVTVTSVSTGRYKLSFTVPSGYAVDDVLELVATWAVSSVNGAALWSMQVDSTVNSRMATFTAPAVDGSGRVQVQVGTGTGQINSSGGKVPATLAAADASGNLPAAVNSIANDAITSSALAASAVTEIQTGLSTLDAAGVRTAVGLASANLDTQLTGINSKTTNLPTDPADASDIAAAFGTVNTSLATIAGYLDTEVTAILAAVDTEVAAIKAKTDNLPADPADASDITTAFGTVNTNLSTLASYVDTEVGAIKAKTDNLPASPAAVSDIPTVSAISTQVERAGGPLALTQASAASADGKLNTNFTNMVTRFLTMIESYSGGTLYRFITGALSQAPTGSGGGGSAGTSLVGLPLRLVIPTADGCECETPQTLVLNRGHIGPVRLDLVDANGVPVSTTSTTLTAKITNTSYADLLDLDDPTEVYGAEGEITVQIDTSAAKLVGKRNLLLIVTRDNGADDVTSGVIELGIKG